VENFRGKRKGVKNKKGKKERESEEPLFFLLIPITLNYSKGEIEGRRGEEKKKEKKEHPLFSLPLPLYSWLAGGAKGERKEERGRWSHTLPPSLSSSPNPHGRVEEERGRKKEKRGGKYVAHNV